MRQSPFIWLGSGRSRKRGVSDKGKMIDLAARGGLPVPQGGIILDEFYRLCLSEGLIERVGRQVVVPDPIWLFEVLYRDIRFPRLKHSVAVRPATAVSSPQHEQTFARLDVDFNNPQQMAGALRKTWSDILAVDPQLPMDLLIMTMVDTEEAGAATTCRDQEEDKTLVFSETDELTQGTISLPKMRAFRGPTVGLPPFARRLQRLLDGVRRTFGAGDYVVDWVDDGQICWLIQVAPV
ncbi:MAG: hypothetical protein R3293_16775 [Candidatus Promineifilaceae bacterium]|nr:hypothetical protein [Candidatus Promineifilaceae bacterium]